MDVFRRFVDVGELDRNVLIFTVIPYIESQDEYLPQWIVDDILGGVDLPNESRVDFLPISFYATLHAQEFPEALIDVMYRRSASRCLSVLINLYHPSSAEISQIAYAEHFVEEVMFYEGVHKPSLKVTADAIVYLKALLKSDRWWVRRYVAEIVWRYDFARRLELLADLKNDSDQRVVDAATREEAAWMKN